MKITEVEITTYRSNLNTAINFYCNEDLHSTITVNTDMILLPEEVALDTNNYRWVEDFIIKNKLGTKISEVVSGFCTYPIYTLDLEKLSAMKDFEI